MKKAQNTPNEWSEDRLQQSFYIWFNNTYKDYRGLLFSVPNGVLMVNKDGTKNWAMIKRFLTTGLYDGVADMIFLWEGRAYFIELKRPDGRGSQSKSQKAWQKTVESQGFVYKLMNDFVELKEFIIFVMNK